MTLKFINIDSVYKKDLQMLLDSGSPHTYQTKAAAAFDFIIFF